MKWSLVLAALLLSSSSVVIVLITLYWRQRNNKRFILPLLNINEYNIILIDEENQCETFFNNKLTTQQNIKYIGFDCEWLSSYYYNEDMPSIESHQASSSNNNRPVAVALLQLAFTDKECVLVRLSKIGKITQSLKLLLSDKSCLKFGVGVANDVTRLSKEYNVLTTGSVDLRNIAVRCGLRRNLSLAGLTEQLTGHSLIKSPEITCSNWEQDKLSNDQILYAARDAIAGLLIFEKLVTKKLIQKGKQQVYDNDSEEWKSCAYSLCQGVIDYGFKDNNNSQLTAAARYRQDGVTPVRTSNAYNIRQTPLYHNCQLIAPDGTLLSTVDIKKVEWYLSKGLGTLESEDPLVLRLSFEPSGKPNRDREYYLTEKENICVVCGKSDGYIRKNVVPHEYRKYFPSKMKEHMSHDVLLLCVNCHQVSSYHDGSFRAMIAAEYCAPLETRTQKYHEDPIKVRLRSLARALQTDSRGKLPQTRRDEIMESISEYFNCQLNEVTNEMIQEMSEIETRQYNSDYVSHGEMVVNVVKERGELFEFQQRWRQHFLDTMTPQYMPKLWSVHHNPS